MNLTHFGHACVLAEFDTAGRTVRMLFDPGAYSAGFEGLRDLDAILLTHEHPDHLDTDRLGPLVKANPAARVIADPGTADRLRDCGVEHEVVRPGDTLTVNEIPVRVLGGEHAVIHPQLPHPPNNAYLVGDALFHPGDAFTAPGQAIDVLLVPAAGPWMKIGEGVDYLRQVAPRVAVPIHQAGLADVHRNLHHQLLTNLAPPETRVEILDTGTTRAL